MTKATLQGILIGDWRKELEAEASRRAETERRAKHFTPLMEALAKIRDRACFGHQTAPYGICDHKIAEAALLAAEGATS